MHILMEALARQNYGGKWYILGDTIPVKNEQDVSDMTALRLARRLPVQAALQEQAPAAVAQRDMDSSDAEAVEASPPVAVAPAKKHGKRYSHREMRVDQR